MTGLRLSQPEDVMAIKDYNVEDRSMWKSVTKEMVESMLSLNATAYTYFKDDKIVACCGAVRGKSGFELWAIYSSKFSAFAFARIDAAVAFRNKFRHLWKTEQGCSAACFSIPADLKNGAKYAKLLGGKFLRKEDSLLFEGVTNDVYEVI